MKRITFIICSILLSMNVSAQLNVQSESAKVEKIGTLRSTYAYLYARDSTYILSIRTTNDFDNVTRFVLGISSESSIQTLNDLISAANRMESGASLEVMDASGERAVITRKTMIGKPYLIIHMSSQAGNSNITVAELEKAIDLIREHAKKE